MFRNQAFGPYLPKAKVDYRQVHCPQSDLVCKESIWIEQSVLLGTRRDMEDIAAAFEKVYKNREALELWSRKQHESPARAGLEARGRLANHRPPAKRKRALISSSRHLL